MNPTATLGHSAVVDARRRALRLIDLFNRLIETVDLWKRRYRERQQFANVDARTLRDCGISESARFIEINKPFWEA
ncbi:MAG TPA: hypothetical protein VKB27_09585 [Gammaproteobacteria bacterium]|nr:hypothetical protein [Gammaproteobacteria bacterium]